MNDIRGIKDGDIIAFVDIGSHSVVIIVAAMYVTSGKAHILAADHKGVAFLIDSDGKLSDNALLEIVYKMEEVYGFHVQNVVVSIGDGYIKFKNIQCGFNFEEGVTKIGSRHIKSIQKSCLEIKNIANNEVVVDLFNNFYVLDVGMNVTDPINLKTTTIQGNYLLIYANQIIINKVNKYILQNKLTPIGFVSAAHASALAVIDKKDKNGVCTVVSIGALDTSITIVVNGYVKKIAHLSIGGNHITMQIIKFFGVSQQDAESIKVMVSNLSSEEDAIISRDTFDTLPIDQVVRISDVQRVIYRSTKDIATKVDEYLLNNSKERPKSVILTGGVAKMLHIDELFQIVLKCHVKIGSVIDHTWMVCDHQDFHTKLCKSPGDSTAVGMIKYVLLRYKQENLTQETGLLWGFLNKISTKVEEFFS